MKCVRVVGDQAKDHSGIAFRDAGDHRCNKSRGKNVGASDTDLPNVGIKQKFYILDATTQVVEHRESAIEQRTAVIGRFNPFVVAFQKWYAKDLLQMRYHP